MEVQIVGPVRGRLPADYSTSQRAGPSLWNRSCENLEGQGRGSHGRNPAQREASDCAPCQRGGKGIKLRDIGPFPCSRVGRGPGRSVRFVLVPSRRPSQMAKSRPRARGFASVKDLLQRTQLPVPSSRKDPAKGTPSQRASSLAAEEEGQPSAMRSNIRQLMVAFREETGLLHQEVRKLLSNVDKAIQTLDVWTNHLEVA
ncbi:hypothetical protein NDU88_000321 [Pleurodeles waltl]|uniref:Uncharacterized protein n=1 Tax=Pleurodeles waltl TaxID=8319 RepID=A0AAV7VWI9_PLEWA|nr:hypothetical protein NDU88_000321 [Pleurodeles waltl]